MEAQPKKQIFFNRRHLLIYLSFTIIIITLFLYFNSLKNNFVELYDDIYITKNETVINLSLKNIYTIFTGSYKGEYKPLTLLSYSIESFIFDTNARSFHRTNLLLHLIVILLVFYFIYLITERADMSFITTLLFAIHPLNVEAVTWISSRDILLFSLFFMATLISYIYYLKYNYDWKYLGLSLFLFLLSLLSKLYAVCLPFILIVIDYYYKNTEILTTNFNPRKLLLHKTPFFILIIPFIIVGLQNININPLPDIPAQEFSIIERFFIACYSIILYIIKIIFPFHLSAIHYLPEKINNSLPVVFYISPIVIILLIIIINKIRTDYKMVLFGAMFFIISILPCLQISEQARIIIAERFAYLPQLGILFFWSIILQLIFDKKIKYAEKIKAFYLIILIILSVYFVLSTHQRNKVWRNNTTLFSDLCKKYPDSFYNYYLLGNSYFNINDYEQGINSYTRAIELYPDFAKAYYNRGTLKLKNNQYAGGLKDFTRAIKINPEYTQAYNVRGLTYLFLNKFDSALFDFNKSISLKEDYVEAYFNRANLKYIIKNYYQALNDFKRVIELDTSHALAYYNCGIIEYELGHIQEAKQYYKRAAELGYVPALSALDTLAYLPPDSTKIIHAQQLKEKFKKYLKDNKLKFTKDSVNGQIVDLLKSYDKQGRLIEEGVVFNGKYNGWVKWYYTNGQLKTIGYYNDTIPFGDWREYYKDGTLKAEYSFINGKLNGIYKYYHRNGRLWTERVYKNGLLWEVISNYDTNGNTLTPGTLKNGTGYVNIYNEQGILLEKKYYKNGKQIEK